MKRLLLALCLLFTPSCFAQVQTTVTGVVTDPSGLPAVKGYVQFDISPRSQAILYRVIGIGVLVPASAKCGIDGTGHVLNLTLTGPCLIWGNDVITPGNTAYNITLAANAPSVPPPQPIQNVLITGSTVDLAAPTFAPIVRIVPQYQTIITDPVSVNIIPPVPHIFNVGQLGKSYAAGYFDNLFATNITITGNCLGPGCPGGGGGNMEVFDVTRPPYNAKCDDPGNGTGTDDTTAFNLAIVAMNASYGGVLYVPKSTGVCRVAGASLVFGANSGSWRYMLFDNGLFLTTALTVPSTVSKLALVGRRGSALGISGSESAPSVNFITGGNFPGIKLVGGLTGFYMEGIGLVEHTGGNTACNFEIQTSGGGGPVQIELSHVMFSTANNTGGNLCAIPTVLGDSTGNSLYVHDSFFNSNNSAVPTIKLTNFQIVNVSETKLLSGGVEVNGDAGWAQGIHGYRFENILTESLTNKSFLTWNVATGNFSHLTMRHIELADNIGNVYGLKGVAGTLIDATLDKILFSTALFDPATTVNTVGGISSTGSGDISPVTLFDTTGGMMFALPGVSVAPHFVCNTTFDPHCQALGIQGALGIGLGSFNRNATLAQLHVGDFVNGLSGVSATSPVINSICSDSAAASNGCAINSPNTGIALFFFNRPNLTGAGQFRYLHSTDEWQLYLKNIASYSFLNTGSKLLTFTHSCAANCVFTMPAATDNIVGRISTDTLTNKTYSGVSLTIPTVNGATMFEGQVSELITLSTIGTTTDSSADLLPANSVLLGVVARITTTITVATDWELGDATIAGRFSAPNATLVAGTTQVGTVMVDQTGTSGPIQTAAAKLRITTTGTPGAGVIRVTVYYRQFVPPTS